MAGWQDFLDRTPMEFPSAFVISYVGEAAVSGVALSAGLRAAGDVKFTMVVTVISTIGIRLLLSVLFGIVLDMGVIGIAFAMCADWLFKAVLFEIRFSRGKWKQFKVI